MSSYNLRILGTAYMFISFAPWIAYWILCCLGLGFGVVIAFIASLLVSFPRIWRKDPSLTDLASIIYFAINTAGTFVFNLNFFVTESGFLGYLTLFSMAIVSLLVK